MKVKPEARTAARLSPKESATQMNFPGRLWEVISPEAQGIDSKRLEKALRYLTRKTGKAGVSETVIARNGRVIWQGTRAEVQHDVWSCTKSFTSTVLGILIDKGKCSLDTLARDWLTTLAPGYPKVTLKHFTTMTSGYDGGGDQSNAPFTPTDPLFPPGTRFCYWDSAMNQFLNVLTRIADEPVKDLFKRSIADPIGMEAEGWDWGDFGPIDGMIVHGGAGNKGKGIHIRPVDLARFGHLFLNRGQWNGRQLISDHWVDQATKPQVPAALPSFNDRGKDGTGRYGFNWWTNGPSSAGQRRWPDAPPGTFAACGFNNNRCFVLPEWKMVVVRMGMDGNVDEQVYNRFFRYLGKAFL